MLEVVVKDLALLWAMILAIQYIFTLNLAVHRSLTIQLALLLGLTSLQDLLKCLDWLLTGHQKTLRGNSSIWGLGLSCFTLLSVCAVDFRPDVHLDLQPLYPLTVGNAIAAGKQMPLQANVSQRTSASILGKLLCWHVYHFISRTQTTIDQMDMEDLPALSSDMRAQNMIRNGANTAYPCKKFLVHGPKSDLLPTVWFPRRHTILTCEFGAVCLSPLNKQVVCIFSSCAH